MTPESSWKEYLSGANCIISQSVLKYSVKQTWSQSFSFWPFQILSLFTSPSHFTHPHPLCYSFPFPLACVTVTNKDIFHSTGGGVTPSKGTLLDNTAFHCNPEVWRSQLVKVNWLPQGHELYFGWSHLWIERLAAEGCHQDGSHCDLLSWL